MTLQKEKSRKQPAAVIDIGAHSARMLIAEVNFSSGSFTPLEELEMPVPLGSEVFRYARISEDSIRLLCGILNNYRKKMQEYGVVRCRAIATSAVREAENAEIFIERIFHATGISLSILDGSDEARLDFLAVADESEENLLFRREKTMIADIGTGACQISGYEKGRMLFTETLKVGTLRALELTPGTISPAAKKQYLADIINKSFRELEHISSDLDASALIVLGSSVRGLLPLLDLQRKEKGFISEKQSFPAYDKNEFMLLYQQISLASTDQLCEKYLLSAEIAETIIPSCVILDNLFHITNAEKLLIPMTSTKYLLLKDFIEEEQGREQNKKSSFEDQMRAIIARTAVKYRCMDDGTLRTASFAGFLFHKLEKLHGLGERERRILYASSMLYKCGLFINNQAYHKHSAYLISNTQIPGLSAEDRAITALTVRYHRKSFPKPQHTEFAALQGKERSIVNKLAAILRISCALSLTAATAENIVVKVKNDRVTVSCPDKFTLLAGFIPEADKDFFRSVFACPITFS